MQAVAFMKLQSTQDLYEFKLQFSLIFHLFVVYSLSIFSLSYLQLTTDINKTTKQFYKLELE